MPTQQDLGDIPHQWLAAAHLVYRAERVEPGTALWFLVEGEIILGGPEGAAADGVVRRAVTTPGYPVGWDGVLWPRRHRWDAVAGSHARLLRVPREIIDERAAADAAFAARFFRLLLWLAGSQLAGSTPASSPAVTTTRRRGRRAGRLAR